MAAASCYRLQFPEKALAFGCSLSKLERLILVGRASGRCIEAFVGQSQETLPHNRGTPIVRSAKTEIGPRKQSCNKASAHLGK